jgi:hypothetical protein
MSRCSEAGHRITVQVTPAVGRVSRDCGIWSFGRRDGTPSTTPGRFHAEFIAASCSFHGIAPSSLTMKRRAALFLQAAILLIGMGILALMLWEPHLEGRNAHATAFEIYFKDPFLAYVYVGSIPFFAALYRAFGLFGHARRNGAFSQETVDALRAIKQYTTVTIGFVAGGVVFILMFGDERPAGVFMSLLVTVALSVIATTAAMCARHLQRYLKAVGRQPELGRK